MCRVIFQGPLFPSKEQDWIYPRKSRFLPAVNGLSIHQKQILTKNYLAVNPAWGTQSLRGRTIYSNSSLTCGPVDQTKPTKCVKSQSYVSVKVKWKKKGCREHRLVPEICEFYWKYLKNAEKTKCLRSCLHRRMNRRSLFRYSEFNLNGVLRRSFRIS